MNRLNRYLPFIAFLASIGGAAAAPKSLPQALQRPAKPKVTAAQILDGFVAATGGRAAYERRTSTVTSIMLTGWAEELSSGKREKINPDNTTTEIYAKAPNLRLTVSKTPGKTKERRDGYDGKIGWVDDEGLKEPVELVSGVMPPVRREAVFNAPLKWRELYEKVELLGVRRVNQRDAYAIRLTPPSEKPIVHYYDTQTRLLVRIDGIAHPLRADPTETYLSDYREVDGVKMPFVMRMRMRPPNVIAVVQITVARVRTNVPLDDALFARPAASSAKGKTP